MCRLEFCILVAAESNQSQARWQDYQRLPSKVTYEAAIFSCSSDSENEQLKLTTSIVLL